MGEFDPGMDYPTKYARNLARVLASTRMKPTRLSLRAGLQRDYVGRILRGVIINPGIDTLRKLATVIPCDVSELMADGEHEPSDEPLRANRRRQSALKNAERLVDQADPARHQKVMRAMNLLYDWLTERE